MNGPNQQNPTILATLGGPKLLAGVLAVLILSVAAFSALTGSVAADHKPADKVAVAGSALEVLEAQSGIGSSSSGPVTLLTGELRTSNPTDLIIQVTAECALFTDIKTIGNDDSQAKAQVNVWVEIDGEPVPVSGQGDDGRVTFCSRDYKMTTSNWEDENATMEMYLHTRNANAFNWITLNTGSDVHTIEVKAELDVLVSGKGEAAALIGARTLVVEPTKLSTHASL